MCYFISCLSKNRQQKIDILLVFVNWPHKKKICSFSAYQVGYLEFFLAHTGCPRSNVPKCNGCCKLSTHFLIRVVKSNACFASNISQPQVGHPIPIPNSGIPVLNSIPNSGTENREIPVFQKLKMAIFQRFLAKFWCEKVFFGAIVN